MPPFPAAGRGRGAVSAQPLRTPAFVIPWVAYLMLSVGDCVTTGYALGHGLAERNPLAAHLYAQAGVGSLWALKAAVLGVMLVLLARLPRQVAIVAAVALALTMAANLGASIGAILAAG